MPKDLYSFEKATAIADLYVEGTSINNISKLDNYPCYATILRWMNDSDEFREMMERARRVRAFNFEEKLLDIAEKAPDIHKDYVQGHKLSAEIYKWAAEVNDASRYGRKTTIEGNPDKPITFNIITGFPDLTPEQRQPKLGIDGLVERIAVIETSKVLPELVDDDERE